VNSILLYVIPDGNVAAVPAVHDVPSVEYAVGPLVAEPEIATNLEEPYAIDCHNDDAGSATAADHVAPSVDHDDPVLATEPPAIATNLPASLEVTEIQVADGNVLVTHVNVPAVRETLSADVETAVPPATPTHLLVA